MKKRMLRLIALLLAAVLLAGCSGGILDGEKVVEEIFGGETQGVDIFEEAGFGAEDPAEEDNGEESDTDVDFGASLDALKDAAKENSIVYYSSMEYERPDMDTIRTSLEDACSIAREEDADTVMEAVYDFYDAYDWFYTCYSLADIRYSGDLTDTYWEEEYNYCLESSVEVDAALEELYYALAAAPCRGDLERDYFGKGYFDSYDGENLWNEEFVELMEEEAQLQNRYYALSEDALNSDSYDDYADEMAQVLVDLAVLRKEIAEYWGYDSYPEFATDFYYYRDYTTAEMERYFLQIQQELVPLYRQMVNSDMWDAAYEYCSEEQTMDYVRQMAQNLGGISLEAFELMERAGLYDITYGENKYNSSFEVYLTSYWEPFIFMNPELTKYDQLTFAHEFGHFCNDYASDGSYAGVDVLEFFSQGMEYLSLCYTDGQEDVTAMKMADSLSTYVEQAAFADFELRMYNLPEEKLTVEGLYDLYDEVALDYGFDSVGYDPREFVDITHFYTNPMYIISYVVSNDAAMQLYQMEQEEPGSGAELFEEHLDTEESYFLAFLEDAGLESPFAQGRITRVRDTFAQFLP